MAKNIVVCCDGTGNEFSDENSNVVKLYATLAIGPAQVAYYHPGVGTMGDPTADTPIGKWWSVLTGLAFGAGINDNIADAYRYLMNTYEEGDRIYLFGFSRGAYTVRALAGMLHMFGLLYRGNEGQIPYILRMFGHHSRQTKGLQQTFAVAADFKRNFSRDCLLHFVGVWDTVSSVGWIYDPIILPYIARNPIMRAGRHAVSIDERRCYFRTKLWGEAFTPAEKEFRVPQDIKQIWFAGVHSDVGGSYPEKESGLSKIALAWILDEAAQQGLQIDPTKAATMLGQNPAEPNYARPDATAMIHESLRGLWWLLEFLPHRYYDATVKKVRWHIPLGQHRRIPDGSVLHPSVAQRMKQVPGCRPPNLPPSAC